MILEAFCKNHRSRKLWVTDLLILVRPNTLSISLMLGTALSALDHLLLMANKQRRKHRITFHL